MNQEITTFEDLEAYKAARELRMYVFQSVIPSLISAKEFDLSNQLKRSSRSVTANIAEGYGRFHYLDNSKFCSNARGSLTETLDHLNVSLDDGIIPNDVYSKARKIYETAIKILNGYINYLYRSANKSK